MKEQSSPERGPAALFLRAFNIARWNESVVSSTARDPEATRGAVLWIGLATLAGAAGSLFFPIDYKGVRYQPTLVEALGQAVFSFALFVGFLYILHFLAHRLFKGRLAFAPFFRVMGRGYVVGLLSVFPGLGFLVVLWMLFLMIRTLERVDGLKLQEAVFSLLLTVMAFVVIFFLGMHVNPGSLYGGFYLAAY